MSTEPRTFEILLVPEHVVDGSDDDAIRSAVVAPTGQSGASGYPRYSGDGMVADIDPVTRTVQAILVDGAELDYGLKPVLRQGS
ncbi:hypothetical protein J7F03_17715 [Streptomyces sp. ISL-43]|uniref:hypothetical protein n=1 Tax=Streptomyces sp. ISL-43 TaxID=2819183 RepID=UPI001BE7F825|nr:hypothetical protein [Streptomyces sp. ISL-43]MBT2448896.1 hypothetical protein [Streptomyces sp. ISL-43]